MNPTITIESPEWAEAVEARAVKLCAAAEPHDDDMPCVIHLHEARRQIFDLWLGRFGPCVLGMVPSTEPTGLPSSSPGQCSRSVPHPRQTNRRGSLKPTAAEGGPVRPQNGR